MKRCQCGRIIWPWQERTVDSYDGHPLHVLCIEPAERETDQ